MLRRAALLSLLLAVHLAGGPSAAHAFVPPPFGKRAPAAAHWTGTWTSSYGPLSLTQEGKAVTGTYVYSNPPVQGSVAGEAAGRTLKVLWKEGPGGAGDGEAVFELSEDGKSFSGTWTGAGGGGGGVWEGTRVDE
ncbi:MAG: hypothetical protein IPJ34_01400 [Myxococcales bacterium]|nr:hypothetical protein [Myxococcales bacterium]